MYKVLVETISIEIKFILFISKVISDKSTSNITAISHFLKFPKYLNIKSIEQAVNSVSFILDKILLLKMVIICIEISKYNSHYLLYIENQRVSFYIFPNAIIWKNLSKQLPQNSFAFILDKILLLKVATICIET